MNVLQNHIIVSQKKHNIEQARQIFINYFETLYQNISKDTLGIKDIYSYLDGVFQETISEILDGSLYIVFALFDDKLIGFTTFNVLENETVILLRTLPVDPLYKEIEDEIRFTLLSYILQMHPQAHRTILLSRRANEAYRKFCQNAGFVIDNGVFNNSYIPLRYSIQWYDAFVFYR